MKIVKNSKLATAGGSGFNSLPLDMQTKLIGKTLNVAIAEGLVTELGDDAGNLFAHATTNEEWKYAIINGCRVTCSAKLSEAEPEDVMEQLGDLTFGGGISTVKGDGEGKYWFNLGLPRTTNLTAIEAVNISSAIAVS